MPSKDIASFYVYGLLIKDDKGIQILPVYIRYGYSDDKPPNEKPL